MKQPKDYKEYGKNGCCPHEWDHTPQITGDYVMDGSIQRCPNKDAQGRLKTHLAGTPGENAYAHNTGYSRGGTDY